MKTIVLDISVPRIALTRLLGCLSRWAYFAPTSSLRLADIPDPSLLDPGWVRVRNRLCGICGSDLHQLYLDVGLDVAPAALPSHRRIYLGHEMVGNVTEIGPAVDSLKPGRRVVRWGRSDNCLARGEAELCPACARGHRVLCERASESLEQRPVGGGFDDSFITPASALLPVPDNLSDEQVIFVEPATVAIHAAWRRRLAAGEQVLVIGCGTIGYLIIQTIAILQPDCHITAMAQFPWQAEMARAFGAEQVFLASDDGFTATAELTGARVYSGRPGNRMVLGGIDAVFDVVGVPGTLNNALRWTRAGAGRF